MDDGEEVEQEIEAIKAIYGDECSCTCETCVGKCRVLNIQVCEGTKLVVYIGTSEGYPSTRAPAFEIHGWPGDKQELDRVCDLLHDMFIAGEAVLFQWVETLRDEVSTASPTNCEHETLKLEELALEQEKQQSNVDCNLDSDSNKVANVPQLEIFHGEKVTVKKSVFQGHLAFVKSVDQVNQVMSQLLCDNRIARATHNIMAYRIMASESATGDIRWLYDNDEDGENAAGGKLGQLLEVMNAKDVVVVVSRWYGGVQLGPQRFKVINNVAREMIAAHCQE